MSQHDNHNHHENSMVNRNVLALAFILTFIFASVELFTAYFTKSLSLFSEGAHMMSDAASLLLSFCAALIATKKATENRTFGFRRVETIAAFLNGLALIIIPIFVFIEAIQRFINKTVVYGNGMLFIAFLGLVINILVAFILSKGNKEENLNLKSAFMHVFADITSSIGVLIAALLIINFDWHFADPIVSIITSIIILFGGIKVTKESWTVLMEGVPENIPFSEVKSEVISLNGVKDVKDLRIWSIASGQNYVNIHILIDDNVSEKLLQQQIKSIFREYELNETIQFEYIN